MLRYLRLFAAFVRFSLSKALEFRFDFFFRIIMDTVFYIVNIGGVKLIYLQTDRLGGWREDQMLLFISLFFVIDAIYMTLFSSNMWWLPTMINKGDLDYYLVRPVSSLFILLLRDFSLNSAINLLIAIGIFAYALLHYQSSFTFFDLAMLLVTGFCGTALYLMTTLLFTLPVFWTHSNKGFMNLFHSLTRFIERPDGIFVGITRLVLVTVLPFSVVASLPATLFFEGFDAYTFFHIIAVTGAYLLLIRVIWNRGLRAYSSASS